MATAASDWVQWEYSHKALEHLTVTQKELLRKREQLRQALVADLTDVNTHSDWRFVVVVGPAGKGKTCFVKDQLERLGYPDLAKKAIPTSSSFANAPATPFASVTSARPTPYVLDKHHVILFDSVGTAPNFDLVRVEATAADTLIVLLADGAQIDQTHADACLLAWRLHHHMNTIFVLPKADQLLVQDRGAASLPDFLAATKLRVAQALHRRLAGYTARAAPMGVQLGADVHLFVQRVNLEQPLQWSAMLLLEPWLNLHAYWSEVDPVSNRPRSSSARGDAAELLRAESRAVQELAFGGCAGLVPSEALAAAGVPVPAKLEVTGKAGGRGSEKSSKDVAVVASRSVRAQCHEIFVNELNNARAQATLYQRSLLPYLEFKATNPQTQGTVLPHEWAVLLNSSNPALNEMAVMHVKSYTTDQSSSHSAIVEAGALRPLVVLLAATTRPTVQQNAAGALRNLAAHPPNRTLIADAGAIPPLVQLLSGPPALVERVSHALHHLALADQNRNLIADVGAVQQLVHLISSPSVRLSGRAQGHAAAVLKQLAVSEKSAAAIKRVGGIPPLIQLVSAGKPEAQEHAVGCLKNLSCFEDCQKEIARQGGIKPIVELINAGGPNMVTGVTLGAQQEAAGALQKLARNNSINRNAIAGAYGIKPLVQLLEIRDPVLQAEAAGALWELGLSDDNEHAIYEAGAIPRLVEMIKSHDKKVHYDAVGCLYILSYADAHKNAIHDAGAVPHLVQLLNSDNIRVNEFAAKTLGNLGGFRRTIRKHIVDEGAAGGLRRMQRCNSVSVRQAAENALSKLGL